MTKLLLITLLTISSCGYKLDITNLSKPKAGQSIISGVISPFLGSISNNENQSLLISSATASACADPVYAKLFKLNSNGIIDESSPIDSQLVGADARYSFDAKSLNLNTSNSMVDYVVKTEGCNGDIYQRPITEFSSNQNIDAKTSIVASVINANNLVPTQLNEADRKQVEQLIKSISGNSTAAALNSLTSSAENSNRFTQIFGASPNIIQDTRPEVTLEVPATPLYELLNTNFRVTTFHVDPNYSFAYKWKVDGQVKSSLSSLNYIPSANVSGNHQIDVFVGKDDGSGNIDLSKPYYTKTFFVTVVNNILPTAPSITLNSSTPSPRNSNDAQIDIATGSGLNNCASFSYMAFTDTNTVPGIMQFNIECTDAGTQTELVNFSNGDGQKTIYLWTMDNEGNISTPSTLSLSLDTIAPSAGITLASNSLRGGGLSNISISASDAGSGLQSLELYFANDGVNYTLLSTLATNSTSYNWAIPYVDFTNAKLKLVATDNVGFSTSAYSSNLAIDSTPPTAPALTRTSSANTSSALVTMTVGSCADISSILINESNTAPGESASGWVSCSTLASNTTYTVSGDGSHTLYAWAKDLAGNVATSANSISMNLDTTNPTIASGPTIATAVAGGSSQAITWTVTDATTSTITLEYYNGSTWNTIATGLTNNGSYTWATVPSLNISTAKLKLTAIDSVGNTSSIQSGNFIIDSTPPVISSFTLAGGITSVALPTVSVQVSGTDSVSSITHMRLSESATYSDNSWQTYSTGSASFTMSSTNGAKTVYIWLKDSASNVSTSSNTTLALDFGNPPQVSISQPDGSVTYNAGDIVPITYSCTGTNGLITNPISISYTIDNGTTFTSIASNVSYTSGSSIYNWSFPSGITQPVRIRVNCSSSAGVVSNSLSQFFNTGGWKVYMGNPTYGLENVNANVADVAGSNIHLFGDAYGNIYYQKNLAVMKIDRLTGQVTRYIGNPTNGTAGCGLSNGANISSITISTPYLIGFDSNSMKGLLVGQACGGSHKIYRIDVDTNAVTLHATLNPVRNFQNVFLTSNKYLIYNDSSRNIYSHNLNAAGNSSILIASTINSSEHIVASHDGSKIWITNYNGSTHEKLTGDITTGNTYSVLTQSKVGNFWAMDYCFVAPFDNQYVYCQNRNGWPLGRTIYVFNPTAETFPTSGTFSYPGNENGGNIALGFMSDKLLIRYLDQIYTSIPNIGGTWDSTVIAGQPFSIYGNGNSGLQNVGLVGAIGLHYVASAQTLYVNTDGATLRKVDYSTSPPTVSTLFGPVSYSAGLNRLNPNGTKIASNYSCSYQYINSLNIIGATSITGSSGFVAGSPGCGNNSASSVFPVPDGTSATASTGGGYFFHGDNGPGKIDFNSFVYHSNGKVYFFASKRSDGSSPMIYSSNSITINQVAGLSEAMPGYNISDSGTNALGAKLKFVQMMLEIQSGVYAGDLLIIDNDHLRRISITTESAAPKIYDVLNLTTVTGYTAGQNIIDFYYDSASESTGLGSGYLYYISNNQLHKLNPQTMIDSTYSFNGTTLSGQMRLAKIPAGLLITQPALKRVLIVEP